MSLDRLHPHFDLELTDDELERSIAAEWRAFKPKYLAWVKKHGEAFLTSYEIYCKQHGVTP